MPPDRCVRRLYIWGLCILLLLSGCAGVQTFPNVARSGDTVALAAGWQHDFSRDDLTVTITAADGAVTVYPPGDPAMRAVVNLYPDPLASILVSEQTNQDLSPFARTYAEMMGFNFTGDDPDWWQTTVFIDLPSGLQPGPATVTVGNAAGNSVTSRVEVIEGIGSPAVFDAELSGPLKSYQLEALERVNHYVVRFSGVTLPYAIQLDLAHDPDMDHGGAGRVHVVNPRGDIKNVSWSGNGSSLRVLLLPVRGDMLDSFTDFKFYVAGGIANLSPYAVQGFDMEGNPVPGVSVEVDVGN